jgi:hypothetical protein
VVFASSAVASAQGKTDVVTLTNGDRITGEIKSLDRGQLEFKTDDAGTLEIEWDNVAQVVATRSFEIETSDGRRLLGSLGQASDRMVLVVSVGGSISLPALEVTRVTPIGARFWSRFDGAVDAGFSYARSSGIAQGTLNSDTVFRKPAFVVRLTLSATLTHQTNEDDRDDRATLNAAYVRYFGQRWLVGGQGSFETNESLGLILRSQAAALVGQRLVNSNRSQLEVGGGLVLNKEQGLDAEPTKNVEGVLSFRTSYYTYDRPKTLFDLSTQYYPSLSSWGRQRLQFDSAIRRELFKDFTVSVNVYDTFDSAPPNPDAERNDVGVVASVGWTY